MGTPIVMPTFGMYTAEGTFGRWLVAPGARVEAGDLVAEITTEKASYEIEAPASGVVHPVAKPGDALTVEGLIGWVLVEGETAPAEVRAATEPEGRAQGPPLRPERTSGMIGPDSGGRGQAPPLRSERSGVGTGGTPTNPSGVEAGLAPARLADTADVADDDEPVPVRGLPAPAATPTPGYLRVKASPAARRLAADRGVDLDRVAGSGPGGRIVEADVLAAAQRSTASPPSRAASTLQVPWRIQRRIPLAGIRGAVARRLREAHATTVPLTLTREVRADALVAARERLRARRGPVSWDAIFVKLFADALRARPALNAVVAGEEIFVLDEVHVGFAVPLPEGLVVPVVRDADARPLAEVAAAVRELGDRARAGTLAPPDVLGGTATVSNLGAQGVDAFTPVLNPPQSAILGVGRVATRPVVEEGKVGAGATCVLSLTFDHRVADGVPAAELLADVAARMGDPDYLDALVAETGSR